MNLKNGFDDFVWIFQRNNSFSNNDSGNFSLRHPGDSQGSFQKPGASGGAEANSASAKNILSDLRYRTYFTEYLLLTIVW